jgi:hypothetical protein
MLLLHGVVYMVRYALKKPLPRQNIVRYNVQNLLLNSGGEDAKIKN